MKLPKVSAVLAAAALAPAVLFPSSAAAADTPQPAGVSGPDTASGTPDAAGHQDAGEQEKRDRAEVQHILADKSTGRGVREAGEKALTGGAAELRHFLEVELPKQRADDDRVMLARIMAAGGPAVQAAAGKALDGTYEDVVAFLKEGQFTARAEDEDRAKVQAILADKSTGRGVREAGEKALTGDAAAVRHFLEVELPKQRADDDRVMLARIMAAGGPAVKAAAGKALDGTYEDVVAFLTEGQFTARAQDEADAARKPAQDRTPDAKPDAKPAVQPQSGQGQGVQPAAVTTTTGTTTTGTTTSGATAATAGATTPVTASARPGQLAATGADGLGWEAGGAGAAVAAGAALVALSRRRRSAEG